MYLNTQIHQQNFSKRVASKNYNLLMCEITIERFNNILKMKMKLYKNHSFQM